MKISIEGKPVFAHLRIILEPGEIFIAESDAMATMSADMDMTAKFNGGFFRAIVKKVFGGESLFVNHFKNNSSTSMKLDLSQPTPGDIEVRTLHGESYCLQKGAYIASDPGVKMGVQWAGLGSLIGGEGLFKLVVSGHGNVYFGAYGGIIEHEINGEYIVDSGHLIAYEPSMKLKPQLAGGLIASLFSGEGFVTRVTGTGKIYLQTRSVSGLASWVNRHL
jgi:uncharacterized protein (TIGR00266 family)